MTAAVTVRGVGLGVEGRQLLRDVDLVLQPGEVVAVVGPNGAGKTSLVRVLSGEWEPSAGSVWILGDDLATLHPLERARRRAVLPQQSVLGFAFRCLDVVMMGRYAAPDGDDTAAVAEAMGATDTTHLADRSYPTLSGGEQTRVAMARVLAQETPVLFLDEPTATLDLRHQELVMGVLRGLAESGAAIMVVLHDLNLAGRHADRVALLAEGRLHSIGTPSEVLTADALQTVYGQRVDVIAHPRDGSPIILPRPEAPAGEPGG